MLFLVFGAPGFGGRGGAPQRKRSRPPSQCLLGETNDRTHRLGDAPPGAVLAISLFVKTRVDFVQQAGSQPGC